MTQAGSNAEQDEWERWWKSVGAAFPFRINANQRVVANCLWEADADRIIRDHTAARDAEARIQALEAALRARSEGFHKFIRTTVEAGSHMHMGPDGDPRWERCIHEYCQSDRALLASQPQGEQSS